MANPESEAAEALIHGLEATYAGTTVRHDKLHRSLGDAHTEIGVYCNKTDHRADALVAQMEFVVQFYGHYNKEVRRDQRVDPAHVYAQAELFRTKLRTGHLDPKSSGAWYFLLEKIEYPDDPTGNKTRYEATIKCYGGNTAYPESG